jgi:4-nitrophenyl phosphatase
MKDKKKLFSNLILDMDGVLWHGERAVPGLAEFFDQLKKNQVRFILATNNATKTQQQYTEKLARFGVEVSIEQILTSSEATAGYLRQTHPDWESAFVVGEIGLHQAMKNQAFTILSEDIEDVVSARADVVVVGMSRHVCYRHLAIANYLINHGAAFVGTNPDITFPHEIGSMPGAGSILAFLQTSSGITPEIIGKPNGIMFEEAVRRLEGTANNTVMVGDRLNTDIAGARSVGLRSVLLLSGIATREELMNSEIQPDWVFENLVEFTDALSTMLSVQEVR